MITPSPGGSSARRSTPRGARPGARPPRTLPGDPTIGEPHTADGRRPRPPAQRRAPDAERAATTRHGSGTARPGPPVVPDPRDLTLGELRTLRRRAHREEDALSYVRRLLHGRIDILRAERRRRDRPDEPLLDRLAQILTDPPTTRRTAHRHLAVSTPAGEEYRELAERLLAEVELSDLRARTDDELRDALGRLARYEARVSHRRQALQRMADGCGAEIARRYREGEASIDDLLAPPPHDPV
ncbi:ABC transporter substrate-binding protein [Streptomyces sp. ST2-7A]|uniref:RsiG family protein n=1 Tax=Streptomyces sp. ST2-7A TaxID=2907214 RepID=UPI001F41D5F3|nr:ABC transporter substrate-binding protein [Streptomyces sp. ST2-7A]MCE7080263.1 ABC transporter substrate-binding protein [Streptomyces sp. ST2-7A]